ncbi:MAG: hypothetical protein LAQ30_29220, partial [Acidobacteriia bacterium]|nr:hypothetical protein [Terriglobia bacterium]
QRFVEWARAKFDIALQVEELKDLKAEQVRDLLLEQTAAKYRRREIEYPVEFRICMPVLWACSRGLFCLAAEDPFRPGTIHNTPGGSSVWR